MSECKVDHEKVVVATEDGTADSYEAADTWEKLSPAFLLGRERFIQKMFMHGHVLFKTHQSMAEAAVGCLAMMDMIKKLGLKEKNEAGEMGAGSQAMVAVMMSLIEDEIINKLASGELSTKLAPVPVSKVAMGKDCIMAHAMVIYESNKYNRGQIMTENGRKYMKAVMESEELKHTMCHVSERFMELSKQHGDDLEVQNVNLTEDSMQARLEQEAEEAGMKGRERVVLRSKEGVIYGAVFVDEKSQSAIKKHQKYFDEEVQRVLDEREGKSHDQTQRALALIVKNVVEQEYGDTHTVGFQDLEGNVQEVEDLEGEDVRELLKQGFFPGKGTKSVH
jgi:hypothetical protein